MSNERKLSGKIALVTGAASGIGAAIAKCFNGAGAKLLLIDKEIGGDRLTGDMVEWLELDITRFEAPEIIRQSLTNYFGRLDILVNNAGICAPGNIETQSDESWDRTLAINITAPFRLTRALLPMLKASSAGRIINLGSIMSEFGGPDLCAYGTSKHAMAGFTKSLAVDLGQYGITCNYLEPGSIWSAMSRPHMADPAFLAYWQKKTPLGRIGDPEDVAAPALFLATDEARFITGAGIRVCGGAMASF